MTDMIRIKSLALKLIKRFFLVVLGLSLLWPAPTSVQGVTPLTLPPGFVDELVVSNLLSPRAFTFTPDGRILILERGSASSNDSNLASVRVFKNGALLATRALTLDVCGDSERGLLGIAVDPNFANNGYVYLYYTRHAYSGSACSYNYHPNASGQTGPRNRVARFTMSGDTINPNTQKILIDDIITNVGYHNAGDLHFGPDGYLYISTGDGGVSSLASTNTNLNGKILRILPTDADPRGYVTTGNPFDQASGARYCGVTLPSYGDTPCREVYAFGLRNPFRFTIQPNTGIPFVGDVGGGVWEEIDSITAGSNYGWPTREGPCANGVNCSPPFTPSGFADPIYSYLHANINANSDSAVIGGAFYSGTAFPIEYRGDYFFADVLRGFIRRLKYNVSTSAWEAVTPDFATGGYGLIGLKYHTDGNLYYISFVSETRVDCTVSCANPSQANELRRIRYTNAPSNQSPVAQISVTPTGSSDINQIYTFSAQGSVDPDGNTPLTYNWDFGNGITETTTALTTTQVYTQVGIYTATLTVTDNGLPPATSSPATIRVYPGNAPPTATIVVTNTTELARDLYHVNDNWEYGLSNPSADVASYSWSIVFHHQTHTHPFIPNAGGAQGSFITNFNEWDPVVWYRIILTLTDPEGQTTYVERDVLPETVDVTFVTQPTGGQIKADNVGYTTTVTFPRVVNLSSSIEAPYPQTINGQPYMFQSWSQGGPSAQTIVIPDQPITYTATFVPAQQIFLPLIRR